MKNYFKKFSVMFVMVLVLILGCATSAFASEEYKEIGSTVLSNIPKQGDILEQPEKGWIRYDDTNSTIEYSEDNWSSFKNNDTRYVNYTGHSTKVSDATLRFSFTGTKLRIIAPLAKDRDPDAIFTLDGVSENIWQVNDGSDNPKSKVIVIQKLNLSPGIHSFVISKSKNSNTFVGIDAIDIDGQLLPYNESLTLDKSTMNLTEGDSGKLTATTTPASVGVTWTVSDPSIATIEVDPTNGKITKVNALKEGTCTITATTNDEYKLSASCTINVTKKDVPKPDNPTTDTKIGAILIINLTDGETKVFDVSSSEVDKFKSWYNNKSEFENKLTYVFNKTVNSNISVEEDVVHNQITSFEIRKY
ncbi:Ig-like domain-containing protein [Clostridium sp. YIM B02555]|uniref:Ig-like domain-containing protein n=1 Tax=Clostridium sp. YIM B02555 TaxID=2911968 RepID=UPI001EED17D5|nr:Ig-like domain-containing protein [Clostridium sp. YIM B02555]